MTTEKSHQKSFKQAIKTLKNPKSMTFPDHLNGIMNGQLFKFMCYVTHDQLLITSKKYETFYLTFRTPPAGRIHEVMVALHVQRKTSTRLLCLCHSASNPLCLLYLFNILKAIICVNPRNFAQ